MQHLQLTAPGGGGGLACRRTLYDSLTVEGLRLSPNPDTQATGNHYTHATHMCIFYLCMYNYVCMVIHDVMCVCVCVCVCVCPLYLVVEACAMMLPPMGFFGSVANMDAPSTCATTWFVITTATPNCI